MSSVGPSEHVSKGGPGRSEELIKREPVAVPSPLTEISTSSALRELSQRPFEGERVELTRRPDGTAVITLGPIGEETIILNEKRLRSLEAAVRELYDDPPNGLVITGSRPGMFCVGADINAIKDVTDPKEGERLSSLGQQLFQAISELPCNKVAAISGPCVGGGAELAFWCDYRIMAEDKVSQIGFPEPLLGILEGFGGTQLVPRVLGLSAKSIKVLTTGATYRSGQAKKLGLVDELVAENKLVERAAEIAKGENLPKRKPFSVVEKLGKAEGLIGRMLRGYKGARQEMLKGVDEFDPYGNYPAPRLIIDSVLHGLDYGLKAGLAREAENLGKLIVTPQAKSLQHVYFCREAAKARGKAAKEAFQDMDVIIEGAGAMGRQISLHMLTKGAKVTLHDEFAGSLKTGRGFCVEGVRGLEWLPRGEQDEILAKFAVAESNPTSLAPKANIVIEAITENLDLKRKLFAGLWPGLSPDALVASNTSTIPIEEIMVGAPNPERCIGLHFFNPVKRMEIVEVIPTRFTSDQTVRETCALVTKLGKFPIVVADRYGFLINRIFVTYLNEAMLCLRDGFTMPEIEASAKKFGMFMAPLRTIDEVGFRTGMHVGDSLFNAYSDRIDKADAEYLRGVFKWLIDNGHLGREQSKSGFYNYTQKINKKGESENETNPNPEIARFAEGKPDRRILGPDHVERRMVLALINEAVRCFDEGVAGPPGRAAGMQIDCGMVLGTGFAPFRGGPIHYAEAVGAKTLLKELRELEQLYPFQNDPTRSRFTPWDGIRLRAENGKSFYEGLR